jgi:hypothetical protein
MSAYTAGVFESYKKELEERNMGTMEIVPISTAQSVPL